MPACPCPRAHACAPSGPSAPRPSRNRLTRRDLSNDARAAIISLVVREAHRFGAARELLAVLMTPSPERMMLVYRLRAAPRPAIVPATCPVGSERPFCLAPRGFSAHARGIDCSGSCVPDACALQKSARSDSVPTNVYLGTGERARRAVGDAHRELHDKGSLCPGGLPRRPYGYGGVGEHMQTASPATSGRAQDGASARADSAAGAPADPRRLGTPRR
jgi:hypothetical protein